MSVVVVVGEVVLVVVVLLETVVVIDVLVLDSIRTVVLVLPGC